MRTYTDDPDPDPDEGGYTVTVPALPGCVTQGETVEQCRERAVEAVAVHLEGLRKAGQPIPDERNHPQLLTVSVVS
jgi:predicted RNase H-like HicB family nuclease